MSTRGLVFQVYCLECSGMSTRGLVSGLMSECSGMSTRGLVFHV